MKREQEHGHFLEELRLFNWPVANWPNSEIRHKLFQSLTDKKRTQMIVLRPSTKSTTLEKLEYRLNTKHNPK